MNSVSLECLLRMKVTSQDLYGDDIEISPEFRVAVQEESEEGVRIIIHANGHNSEMLDFWVLRNGLSPVGSINKG